MSESVRPSGVSRVKWPLIDGTGNLIVAEEGAPFVGVVGVTDLVVVATKDAILVIPKSLAQDVKKIVEAAKKSGRDDLL